MSELAIKASFTVARLLLNLGNTPISADLSMQLACTLDLPCIQPSALLGLAMPPWAFTTAQVACQEVQAVAEALARPRSAQQRAHLLATKVRQRPTTEH